METGKLRQGIARLGRLLLEPELRWWRFVVVAAGLGLALSGSLSAELLPSSHVDEFAGHPRVIVISDIGNEPDDQMQPFVCCCTRMNSTSKG